MKREQDPFFIAELISRYRRGVLTYNESEQLRKWIEDDVENQQLFESLSNEQAIAENMQFFSSVDKNKAWQNITSTINESSQQQPTTFGKYWRSIAAAMIIGILSYGIFEYTRSDELSKLVSIDVPLQTNDVLPGGNKATLTLADGSVVLLEDMINGTVKEENGIRISKEDGQIVYEIIDQQRKEEIFYNTIHTPIGGQYNVVLPDGSRVWLNSESTLHFPTAFSGSYRTVDLTGEGYFEIAKNTEMPFVVQASKTRVEVLGTHFNLMAYGNEGPTKTTLLEGSVKVGNGIDSKTIMPGQQAVTADRIQVINTDPDEAIAWKNGYFQFESENLQSIMRQLKRWYDVELEDEHNIPDKHFTAVISRNTTLSQVLKMLEMSGELKFKVEGKKISIQENQ